MPLAIPVFVRSRDEKGKEFLEFATALNVSAGGVLVAVRRSLPLAAQVLLEIAKLPLMAKPVKVMTVPLVKTFFTVTVFGGLVVPTFWLENTRARGDRDTAVPMPLSGTAWGLPPSLSATLKVPVRVFMKVGANAMLTLQLAPAASVLPHVLDGITKSPVVLKLLNVSVVVL